MVRTYGGWTKLSLAGQRIKLGLLLSVISGHPEIEELDLSGTFVYRLISVTTGPTLSPSQQTTPSQILPFSDLKQLTNPAPSLPDAVVDHKAVSIASLIFACLPNLSHLSLAQTPQYNSTSATGFRFATLDKLRVLNIAGANGAAAEMRALLQSAPYLRVLIANNARELPLDAVAAGVEEMEVSDANVNLDAARIQRSFPRLRRIVFRQSHRSMFMFGMAAQQPPPAKLDIPGVECVCCFVVCVLLLSCLCDVGCSHVL